MSENIEVIKPFNNAPVQCSQEQLSVMQPKLRKQHTNKWKNSADTARFVLEKSHICLLTAVPIQKNKRVIISLQVTDGTV